MTGKPIAADPSSPLQCCYMPKKTNKKTHKLSKNGFSSPFFLAGLGVAVVIVGLSFFTPVTASIQEMVKTRFIHAPLSEPKAPVSLSAKVTYLKTANASQSGTPATPSHAPVVAPRITNPIPQGRSVNVPILMYHYVGLNPDLHDHARDILSVTPDNFDAQLSYLESSGFTAIDFETLYNGLKGIGGLPAKPILLTFDDGYIDFFINAYPILQRHHMKGTVFIPTGLMGTSFYLHWDQIKQMQGSGLISFQAHSVNHVNLAALSGTQLKYEIEESRRVLSEQIGVPVDYFAYPFGASNEETWNAVKAAGFKAAVGTWPGTIHTEGTQYDLPRLRISGNIDLAGFTRMIH